ALVLVAVGPVALTARPLAGAAETEALRVHRLELAVLAAGAAVLGVGGQVGLAAVHLLPVAVGEPLGAALDDALVGASIDGPRVRDHGLAVDDQRAARHRVREVARLIAGAAA